METNECLENNGGCWQDKAANITACKEDRWGDSGEIQCRSNFQFTRGIWAVRGITKAPLFSRIHTSHSLVYGPRAQV
ncbi:hypothetical protein OROGR_029410 [Orobanche gracilis]